MVATASEEPGVTGSKDERCGCPLESGAGERPDRDAEFGGQFAWVWNK